MDEDRWCLLTFNEDRWCLPTMDEDRWCLIVFDDTIWCQMIHDGIQASKNQAILNEVLPNKEIRKYQRKKP